MVLLMLVQVAVSLKRMRRGLMQILVNFSPGSRSKDCKCEGVLLFEDFEDHILYFHVLCLASGIRNEYDLVVIWSYYSHDNQRDIGYQRAKETDLHQYRSSTKVAFRRREICRKKRTITLYPNIIFQK